MNDMILKTLWKAEDPMITEYNQATGCFVSSDI